MKIKKKSLLNPKTFNYLYSIGASIVILGALFKLLHVTGADLMLVLGMGTEAFIFFMSAFDEPSREPNWENVYPGIYNQTLSSEEKATIAERRAKQEAALEHVAGASANGTATTIIGNGVPVGGTFVIGGGSVANAPSAQGEPSATTTPNAGGMPLANAPLVADGNIGISPEQADQVTAATQKYVTQLNEINAALEKLSMVMSGVGGNENYADQISQLNRNIQGLNTIYEIQLKSVSSQLSTIEEVNRGLNNIRSLYENGANDSYRIRQESDQLARNLQQLNEVYARMLQAMTTNMK
ncbi:MAG: gliding motility protein GldL [Bacteroidales bacterium]|nr:gliding motility protein GldL [Bacteroidales bacterium]